jgi:threonine/homoserine/homoserine lactone efflux protein
VLIAYLTFTVLFVITPGATTAVVVGSTLAGGRAAGLAAASGAALANTSHAAAAGLGLALLFARWPLALAVLRVVGAAYLAWLGAASLYRAAQSRGRGGVIPAHPRGVDGGDGPGPKHVGSLVIDHRTRSFRRGLTVNLLNPSIATFYLVAVPSFVPRGASIDYFALLAALHVLMAFACHGGWAIAFHRVRQLFARRHAQRAVECATGIALLVLAMRLWAQP